MLIISVGDNENNGWKRNTKSKRANKKSNKDKKEHGGEGRSYGERVRAKKFWCAFELGFLQLVCKASLMFQSSLELALSIILKQR